jgi:hypothetical protein
VTTKNQTRTYVDRESGFDKTITDVKAYYYTSPSKAQDKKDDFGL